MRCDVTATSVKAVNTIFNCVPGVNTINGLIQAVCKKVYTPVDTTPALSKDRDPSLGRSIQIHILNKDACDLFFDSLPIIGNIVALVKLVIAIINGGFKSDLEKAVTENNKEVIYLCLENDELAKLDKVEEILKVAALSSDNEIFQKIITSMDWSVNELLHVLNDPSSRDDTIEIALSYLKNKYLENYDLHNCDAGDFLKIATLLSDNKIFKKIINQRDWNAWELLGALYSSSSTGNSDPSFTFRADNIKSILDYWEENKINLNNHNEIWFPSNHCLINPPLVLGFFLNRKETALFDRMIEVLPKKVISPFGMRDLLLNHSCVQYNSSQEPSDTAVLTKEQRNALIPKSAQSNLEELEGYYYTVVARLGKFKTADNYTEVHFDLLNQLVAHAQLQPDEIGKFIFYVLCNAEELTFSQPSKELTFIESLITNHEQGFSLKTKLRLLREMQSVAYANRTTWAVQWNQSLHA